MTGLARITKSGSGTLVIANTGTNDYTGGTLISGGTLQIGDAATGLGGSLSTGPVTNTKTSASPNAPTICARARSP